MAQFFSTVGSEAGLALFFVTQFFGLLLIPFGIPGTLVQVLAAAMLATASNGARMGWKWVGIFLVLALLGEVTDVLSGQWGAKRFGGSRSAAWGALIGGLIGAVLGQAVVPIPIVGAIIASFLGTFAGAVLGEMHAQKKLEANLRVGMGAVIGRAIGTGIKLCIGLMILIASIMVVFSK